MTVALILLLSLVAVGLPLYLHHRLTASTADVAAEVAQAPAEAEECCGQHLVCERLSPEPGDELVYYDDYELDAFRGRLPESYSADETEAFRDVLLTMQESDVAGWARSLQMRGIEPPTDVRQEMIMMLAEQRLANRNRPS